MYRHLPLYAIATLLVLYAIFFLIEPTDRWLMRQLVAAGWTFRHTPEPWVPVLDFLYRTGPWPAIVIAIVALALRLVFVIADAGRVHRPLDQIERCSRRRLTFVVLAFLIGPGLVVNTVFKDHFGRARPVQTIEFGGQLPYTPPGKPAQSCARNCSFPSGHAAAAFFPLTLAFLLAPPWRRYVFVTAVMWGSAVGVTRVLQGGHWPSDVASAFIIVLLVSAALHRLMLNDCPDCPLHAPHPCREPPVGQPR